MLQDGKLKATMLGSLPKVEPIYTSLQRFWSLQNMLHAEVSYMGFSPSDVRERMPHKSNYATIIRLLLRKYTYTYHSLIHIVQETLALILVNQA